VGLGFSVVDLDFFTDVRDDPHDAAEELHERAQVVEDAEHRDNTEIRVVKPFAELADLNDDIEFVILQLTVDAFVHRGALGKQHYAWVRERGLPSALDHHDHP